MNILKHELRLYYKTTLTWAISIAFLVILFGAIYPTFSDSVDVMNKVLENFPEGFKEALGLGTMDLGEPLGFYGFMFMYITLTGAIQAMNLGLSILSNELRDKTADFLMAKPVKRIKILHAKFSAALINIVVTNIIFIIVSKIVLNSMADEGYSSQTFIFMACSLFLIQLFFLSFGMFISVFMDKMKSVVPISMGMVFGFFVLNMLNESLDGAPLSAITPFAYFSPGGIYETQSYDTKWLILNLVLVVVFSVGAYIRYIKKDIPSV